MAEVILQDVSKRFGGDAAAVADLNLHIRDGEFLVLVGPSGCGKSTTLNMIAGLERASGGTIRIGDRVVNDVPAKDRDIAMVFQSYALYPHMTVYQNMAFALKLRKYPRAEIDRRIRDAAEVLGISPLLDRRPEALSGGQRQRVAVGRAIVRQPQVFLFDEPLSNLDAKLRVQMRVEISELHAKLRTTTIYVTHDQTEAMTMGDRIVVMKDGRVQQVADPVTLYDAPVSKFVASFIGTPPMNLFDGRLRSGEGGLIFEQEGGISLPLPEGLRGRVGAYGDREITLGLRPEDIGSAQAEASGDAVRLRGRVKVVEVIGPEAYLYVDSAQRSGAPSLGSAQRSGAPSPGSAQRSGAPSLGSAQRSGAPSLGSAQRSGAPSISAGRTTFIARVDSHRKFQVGQQADLAVQMSRAHFFDKGTELAVA